MISLIGVQDDKSVKQFEKKITADRQGHGHPN